MKVALALVNLCCLLHFGGLASAEEVTVGELRMKGATVLSAEEIKLLLTGATVRYESSTSHTQMKLEANGTIVGSSTRRIGGSGGSSIAGEWRVTDEGRWCGSTRSAKGTGAEWCRSLLKLGDKYYYASGAAKDGTRPAYEVGVSR